MTLKSKTPTPPQMFISIKFPHGKKFIEYDETTKKFVEKKNINDWLNGILSQDPPYTNHIFYNDDPPTTATATISKKPHSSSSPPSNKYGHCKGILKWNTQTILWLRHSVPEYPVSDTNFKINKNQLIYGQSFHCVKIPFTINILNEILMQLEIMNAYIYSENRGFEMGELKHKNTENISTVVISEKPLILSIVKPSQKNSDIYSDVMEIYGFRDGKVETWIRGHKIINVSSLSSSSSTSGSGSESRSIFSKIKKYLSCCCCCFWKSKKISTPLIDIKQLNFEPCGGDPCAATTTANKIDIFEKEKEKERTSWKNSQDHSKWAIFDDEFFAFSDLNRMTSQYKRGGGLFLCKDPYINRALSQLIVR